MEKKWQLFLSDTVIEDHARVICLYMVGERKATTHSFDGYVVQHDHMDAFSQLIPQLCFVKH